MSVRPSVHIKYKILHVGRILWVMYDGMQYDLIQGQGHEPLKVGNPSIFKSCLWKALTQSVNQPSALAWLLILCVLNTGLCERWTTGATVPRVCEPCQRGRRRCEPMSDTFPHGLSDPVCLWPWTTQGLPPSQGNILTRPLWSSLSVALDHARATTSSR